MITALLHSSRRLLRRPPQRRRRMDVFAQAHGQTMLIDCQRHGSWWSGVVKIREASTERVVHVCCELRNSADDALGDAEQDAQRLSLMFVQ
ncbi:hypothetical protein [Variovorax sp. KK3]|uniref:hypothetical protein n=1 Tax=Variovorax sp. KK3 TaxID=1855728 RepID=UPI00097BB54F|nr:hypothetical protein [Variovorax sp. KK3]